MSLKGDTLYAYLVTANGKSFAQRFIKRYDDLRLNVYMETDVAKLFIEGKFSKDATNEIIEFKRNGQIMSKAKQDVWHYRSFKFISYGRGCSSRYQFKGVVELPDGNRKELYVIKSFYARLDFYKVKKLVDGWIAEEYDFAFTLYRKKS